MRPLLRAPVLLAALVAVTARAAPVALPRGVVVQATYVSPADGVARAYALRTPSSWDGTSLLPAVLLLHGRGGTRWQFQSFEYFEGADDRGAVLVFWEGRRVPGGTGDPSTHYVDGVDGVPDETDVLACLDDALARAPIDPDRVALAGFSQGGRGALNVGLLNPSRFAALVDAAGPTDAFQGQLWSPAFPDYASAAGGPPSAGGEVLARWYELSPRFLLANARNLFVAVLHGQADAVVPDSSAFFPYRNGHHVSVTPGFADARGRSPTLSELRAGDPAGYAFATWFPGDVGHEQRRLIPPAVLFDAALGRARPSRPPRVAGLSYGSRERTFHWARLARASPPDGTRVFLDATADPATNGIALDFEGPARVRLDLPAAGLDASRSLSVGISGRSRLDLALAGPFLPVLAATLDGASIPLQRTPEGVTFPGLVARSASSLLVVSAAPPGPLAEPDLLVPALVDAPGANGARYETVLTVGNASETAVVLSALLLDGEASPFPLQIPARSSRSFGSAELLAASDRVTAATPFRLRVVSGDAGAVVASARVFNVTSAGTYGLSFPVLPAGGSVEAAGSEVLLFGPRDPGAERMNVSLFAPFEASAVEVAVLDPSGQPRRTLPVDLAPLRRAQLDGLLAGEAAGAAVRVTVLAGRVQVWGTVVSNGATNDPYRVPALAVAGAGKAWTVPAVAAIEGRNGAVFRSDLFLHSPLATSVSATLLPLDGGAPAHGTLHLPGGSSLVVPDLLATLFPAKAPGAGALLLTGGGPFLPLAITRSAPAAGPSSQDLPCVAAGLEATPDRPVAFAGVDESPAARSNLVLVAANAPARVRLVLLGRDGPRGERELILDAGRVVQLDSFAATFSSGDVEGATLLVQPVSGSVVASVARIDNATNDPSGLSPLPFVPR